MLIAKITYEKITLRQWVSKPNILCPNDFCYYLLITACKRETEGIMLHSHQLRFQVITFGLFFFYYKECQFYKRKPSLLKLIENVQHIQDGCSQYPSSRTNSE